LNSSLTVMHTENVALRQAHDNSIDEVDRLKQENTRLTASIIKVKEEQMAQMDEWRREFERLTAQYRDRQLSSLSVEEEKVDHANGGDNLSLIEPNYMLSMSPQSGVAKSSISSNGSSGNVISNSKGLAPPSSSQQQPERSRSLSKSIVSTISNLFGATEAKVDANANSSGTPRSPDDIFVARLESGAALVGTSSTVLLGPPIFNVTPPQLVCILYYLCIMY
ncbi:hypothetical protein RFI_03815, partial [Reticulomyxa filosa]